MCLLARADLVLGLHQANGSAFNFPNFPYFVVPFCLSHIVSPNHLTGQSRCETQWESSVAQNRISCYRFSGSQTLSWIDASNACRANGAYLVSLTDAAEEVRLVCLSICLLICSFRRHASTKWGARRLSCWSALPTTPAGISDSSSMMMHAASAGSTIRLFPAS